jgi:hypothetical protein
MHQTVTDRRTFLLGLAAFLGLPATARGSECAMRETVIASTVRRPDGSFAAVLYDLNAGLLNSVALPARGHDVAVNPRRREVVAFARRPGTFAVAFSRDRDRAPAAFSTPPGRHFYGHGVFSRDGRLLYTTENDYATGAGCIGVWDAAAGYRRIGEIPSHGIGPHDVNLLGDGHTLVIANGGIATHPDHGREPLNLASMRPSLAYVDRLTGDLVERQELPAVMHQSSIRHLDVGAGDTVVFGCQFKGAKTGWADLIGFHRPGEAIELLSGGPTVHRALRHYVSSIAVDRAGEVAGITSSRGNGIVLVDVARRTLIGVRSFADVSGIAVGAEAGRLVITSGTGDLGAVTPAGDAASSIRLPWSWDNHAVGI